MMNRNLKKKFKFNRIIYSFYRKLKILLEAGISLRQKVYDFVNYLSSFLQFFL